MSYAPKSTDSRQGVEIARAIAERVGGELETEGLALLALDPLPWPAILDWSKRACEALQARREAR